MKVELKQIIDQVTEALDLPDYLRVCALIDDIDNNIVGWNVAEIDEYGDIRLIFDKGFENLKEMFKFYHITQYE